MRRLAIVALLILFIYITARTAWAALPSSTNYKLQDYGFGSGGTATASSSHYTINGTAGEVEFGRPGSASYQAGGGLTYENMSNVPGAPTLSTGGGTYYNKLGVTLNTSNNPSDTQFAVKVNTQYVQADDTLGSSPVWQTNTSWGASGFTIVGLTPGTTYTISVAARQGNFTQSPYGPTASYTTANPQFTFYVTPNSVDIGQLTPATVVTAPTTITANMSTNGTGGGVVYIYDSNAGLLSPSTSYTISAVSNDLSSLAEGYGVRGTSTSQSSGGPMEIISPYNGAGTNVGLVDSTKRPIFDSTNAPVTSGQAVFEIKAKASSTTKAATDYSDTLFVVASATF